jgi:dTDP-4-dehydrorhamnose 3,5-epimerase
VEIKPLNIKGAWLAKSRVLVDGRGDFREWFKPNEILEATGIKFDVRQGNISTSSIGVVRGIHYSLAIPGQAKWVTCVSGQINDVIVDIRPNSETYGKHVVVNLAGGDGFSVLIEAGLGHGFVALTDTTTVAYLVTSPFSPTEEFEIYAFDPALGISWGLPEDNLILSQKDKEAPTLDQRRVRKQLPN